MERSSLGLRIPPGLLPSSRFTDTDSFSGSNSLDDSSAASDSGLGLRTGRSHAAAARQPLGAGAPRAVGQNAQAVNPAATTFTEQANASSSLSSSPTASLARDASSMSSPRTAVERVGSRLARQAGASPLVQPAAAAASRLGSEPASAASRAASPGPDCYADDGFESDGSGGHPASTIGAVAIANESDGSGRAGGRSVARPGSAKGGREKPPSRSASCSSSRLGYLASTAATRAHRPSSAAVSQPSTNRRDVQQWREQQARPRSPSPAEGHSPEALEARVGRQMQRDPEDWTVREVCDWLELIGLGQYRRRFVHNAVGGALLLRLSNEELKADVGIGPLGHRQGLLTAVHDLEQYWRQLAQQGGQQPQQQQAQGEYSDEWAGERGGTAPSSPPPPRLADCSLQRAYAQRARLVRELEKAEGREAQRRTAAEQAARVVGQASEEVRKLQATICELDRELGWPAAAEQQHFDPTDVHGVVAWQPAGRQRPRSGSPAERGRPGSPAGGCGPPGSPMSRLSRRIMAEKASGGFLERLDRDVGRRQTKAAAARRRAGCHLAPDAEHRVEQERERRDLRFVSKLVQAKSSELAQRLRSDDDAVVAAACDEVAAAFQQEWGLEGGVAAAVRIASGGGKKAARLAAALRSAQFMQRLETDLSTREERLRQLQQKHFKLEAGSSPEQQEAADLAAAQQHFRLLGWAAADVDVKPGAAAAPCDALLAALLRRAAAVQEARERSKAVDWGQQQWSDDKLDELQQAQNASLQAALDAQAAAAAAQQQLAGGGHGLGRAGQAKEAPQPKDRVAETVQRLAACRPAEVALLQGLSGHRKLLMTWRAVRAQQFISFTRADLEQRKAKAAALERQLYPDNTKVLPKQEFEAFFLRLMDDTTRRAQHREELAEQTKLEALAKLKGGALPPVGRPRMSQPVAAA